MDTIFRRKWWKSQPKHKKKKILAHILYGKKTTFDSKSEIVLNENNPHIPIMLTQSPTTTLSATNHLLFQSIRKEVSSSSEKGKTKDAGFVGDHNVKKCSDLHTHGQGIVMDDYPTRYFG